MYRLFLYLCFFPSIFLQAQDLLLQINAHNDVDFIFVDPSGKRTGVDRRFSSSEADWRIYREILNANYDLMEIPEIRPNIVPSCYRELLYGYQAPSNDGNYLIQVIGNELCTFNIYVDISFGSLPPRNEIIKIKSVPIDKDSIVEYQLIIDSFGENLCKLEKLIKAQSLIQDVSTMFKLGWIKTEETLNLYLTLFGNFKTQYDAQDYASARTSLNTVIQNLVSDTTSAITIDAYKLLRSDVEKLLTQLPDELSVTALIDSLHSQLQKAYSNNWIGNQTFVQILEQSLQNAKSKYTAKDSIGCAQAIESFYKLVRLKYIAPGTQFVRSEAYNLLYNYAREIIGKVIVLPPKTNATLINQITALKTQIRTDASGKLVGGELLLRGLESSLEIARQKLQKSDSTSAALYITLFQQTVRQTYEITKKYPSSRIYVKAGGYISLYYRAEYILEHLTIPIGQPMPKMTKELEEELGKYQEVSR